MKNKRFKITESQRIAAYENMRAFGYDKLSAMDKAIIDFFTK